MVFGECVMFDAGQVSLYIDLMCLNLMIICGYTVHVYCNLLDRYLKDVSECLCVARQ